MLERYKVLE